MRVDSLTLSLLLGASNEADVCCWCDLPLPPLPGRKAGEINFSYVSPTLTLAAAAASLLFFLLLHNVEGVEEKRAQTRKRRGECVQCKGFKFSFPV